MSCRLRQFEVGTASNERDRESAGAAGEQEILAVSALILTRVECAV